MCVSWLVILCAAKSYITAPFALLHSVEFHSVALSLLCQPPSLSLAHASLLRVLWVCVQLLVQQKQVQLWLKLPQRAK